MFVEVRKAIELPKRMVLKGIRSVIRLKRFEHIARRFHEGLHCRFNDLAISMRNDREFDFPSGILLFEQRQLPCKLVKSGSERIDEFAQAHSENRRQCLEVNSMDVPRVFVIISSTECMRLITEKSVALLVEGVEVLQCTVGFHFNVNRAVTG